MVHRGERRLNLMLGVAVAVARQLDDRMPNAYSRARMHWLRGCDSRLRIDPVQVRFGEDSLGKPRLRGEFPTLFSLAKKTVGYLLVWSP